MCRVDDKGERCSKVVSRRQNDVSFFSKFFSSTKKRIWEKVEKNSKKKGPCKFLHLYLHPEIEFRQSDQIRLDKWQTVRDDKYREYLRRDYMKTYKKDDIDITDDESSSSSSRICNTKEEEEFFFFFLSRYILSSFFLRQSWC